MITEYALIITGSMFCLAYKQPELYLQRLHRLQRWIFYAFLSVYMPYALMAQFWIANNPDRDISKVTFISSDVLVDLLWAMFILLINIIIARECATCVLKHKNR
ncbi:hypothetical protein ACPV5W_19515 [Vibrio astriarenae]